MERVTGNQESGLERERCVYVRDEERKKQTITEEFMIENKGKR